MYFIFVVEVAQIVIAGIKLGTWLRGASVRVDLTPGGRSQRGCCPNLKRNRFSRVDQ